MATKGSRKIISFLHLWPGIISAIIVFFVCITGTIIVYNDEIIELSAGDARYVQEVKSDRLSASEIFAILKEKYPNRNVSYTVAYKDPHRSMRFNTYNKDEGLRMVYVDPYTGTILKDDGTIYFFYVMAHLHSSLLLGTAGEWIVDIATLIFVLELVTGIILWLPRRMKNLSFKKHFVIKRSAGTKRFIYDSHRILGLYAIIILLILSTTGLLIAFKPLSSLTMTALGADENTKAWRNSLPTFSADKPQVDMNTIIERSFAMYPNKSEIQVEAFKLDTKGYYFVRVADRIGLKSAQNSQIILFDRTTGEPLAIPEKVMKHEKIGNSIWVLHMGNWMGQFGKLITFLGGLIASSLPITGFYIWNKKRKKSSTQ